ncbi:uncharacterized protein LOC127182362 isoform X2 [Labeo rohita]|uniref:uncharacterized protein LOC127182362 isoform X2 n=1 Tax=Labeo rohita TaxID=84645 RepID=UPI0021E1D620|nr:uncharacterized protein LOC127182362 isoform X2 [Labeo rohita]
MFRWLNLLLLFCLFSYSETTIGNIVIHVTGQKGEDATLPCDIQARHIFHLILNSLSQKIIACQNEACKSENVRVFKTGACDIVIKDLRLSDAGTYILKIHYNSTAEVQIREYHLQIHDEISVKTGEQLKLDVLLSRADKVETNSSGEWNEVWKRGHGVWSDRMTDRDGNLTIKEFTSNDTGTYRVLDSKGEILITVTVTESSTESDSKSTGDDKPNDTEQHTEKIVIGVLTVFGVLVVLALVIVAIKKSQPPNGGFFPVRWIRGTPEGS